VCASTLAGRSDFWAARVLVRSTERRCLWFNPWFTQSRRRGMSRPVPSAVFPVLHGQWETPFRFPKFKHFQFFLKQSKRSTRLRFIALVYHQLIRPMGRDFPSIGYELLAPARRLDARPSLRLTSLRSRLGLQSLARSIGKMHLPFMKYLIQFLSYEGILYNWSPRAGSWQHVTVVNSAY